MPRGRSPARPRRPRRLSPRLIVACEGRKSEYNYFTEFNRSIRGNQRAALVVVAGSGGTAINVVERAIHERVNDRRAGKYDPREGDRAYAVIDVEPHDSSKAEPLQRAISLAANDDIKILLSNPSFEFWLLCHVSTPAQLKQSFPHPATADGFLKDRCGLGKDGLNARPQRYEQLIKKVEHAVDVARDVHQNHHRAAIDLRKANGCTDVYRLVEFLLGLSQAPP